MRCGIVFMVQTVQATFASFVRATAFLSPEQLKEKAPARRGGGGIASRWQAQISQDQEEKSNSYREKAKVDRLKPAKRWSPSAALAADAEKSTAKPEAEQPVDKVWLKPPPTPRDANVMPQSKLKPWQLAELEKKNRPPPELVRSTPKDSKWEADDVLDTQRRYGHAPLNALRM